VSKLLGHSQLCVTADLYTRAEDSKQIGLGCRITSSIRNPVSSSSTINITTHVLSEISIR
jgi:hypothetical protein